MDFQQQALRFPRLAWHRASCCSLFDTGKCDDIHVHPCIVGSRSFGSTTLSALCSQRVFFILRFP
eukprot:m.681951 g.681951  ORF g.681951 m.681951 type:complete len:65 (-) comp22815_c0_seq8:2828-3022(-)